VDHEIGKIKWREKKVKVSHEGLPWQVMDEGICGK
jgi:hypothetical protein